jgi:hypothetical protein
LQFVEQEEQPASPWPTLLHLVLVALLQVSLVREQGKMQLLQEVH